MEYRKASRRRCRSRSPRTASGDEPVMTWVPTTSSNVSSVMRAPARARALGQCREAVGLQVEGVRVGGMGDEAVGDLTRQGAGLALHATEVDGRDHGAGSGPG